MPRTHRHLALSGTALAAICSLVAACGVSDAAPAPIDPAHSGATEGQSDNAVATFLKGGDYRFSLEQSAVLADVQAGCQEKAAAADAAERSQQVSACMQRVRSVAAAEGVEITPIGDSRVRYVSYGDDEEGNREHYIEAEATVGAFQPGIVVLTDAKVIVPADAPADGVRFLIEVVDEATIAMDKVPGAHPKNGDKRLVFHRSAR